MEQDSSKLLYGTVIVSEFLQVRLWFQIYWPVLDQRVTIMHHPCLPSPLLDLANAHPCPRAARPAHLAPLKTVKINEISHNGKIWKTAKLVKLVKKVKSAKLAHPPLICQEGHFHPQSQLLFFGWIRKLFQPLFLIFDFFLHITLYFWNFIPAKPTAL